MRWWVSLHSLCLWNLLNAWLDRGMSSVNTGSTKTVTREVLLLQGFECWGPQETWPNNKRILNQKLTTIAACCLDCSGTKAKRPGHSWPQQSTQSPFEESEQQSDYEVWHQPNCPVKTTTVHLCPNKCLKTEKYTMLTDEARRGATLHHLHTNTHRHKHSKITAACLVQALGNI